MRPDSLSPAVLVSIGRHPVSGRPRRADLDARAVELALQSGACPEVVHVGDEHAALRDYLGMGLDCLTVLQQSAEADAVPALAEHLRHGGHDCILTGARTEQGEGSGMLPFLLAERLGWALVPGIMAITAVTGSRATLRQALPRGRRRTVSVDLPFVASVDAAAPAPRQSAFGHARRGRIHAVPTAETVDEARRDWTVQPARQRPKRLKVVKAASAAERLRAATAKTQAGSGRVIRDEPPATGARAILDLLREEGVWRG